MEKNTQLIGKFDNIIWKDVIKPAENRLNPHNSDGYNETEVYQACLKIAKLAYNQALEDAAASAYCDIIHPPDDDYPELEESEYQVIKSSILKLKL